MGRREQPEFEKLGEMIADIRVAMVTTVEADGTLHARPMALLSHESGDELWFFTKVDSAKVDELQQDMRVSVSFSDTAKNSYVAIAGTADIVRDPAKAKELWTPFARAWFPEGLDDPELVLMRVRMERAEYWTSPGKAAYLLGVAKAALTGRETRMGEDRKLQL
jgi:PPOX class probable F420-dependent enzyme